MDMKVTTRSDDFEGNEWIPKGIRWYCEPEFPMPSGIKGCPLGRGDTEQGAIKDLIYRIEIESKVIINPVIIDK